MKSLFAVVLFLFSGVAGAFDTAFISYGLQPGESTVVVQTFRAPYLTEYFAQVESGRLFVIASISSVSQPNELEFECPTRFCGDVTYPVSVTLLNTSDEEISGTLKIITWSREVIFADGFMSAAMK